MAEGAARQLDASEAAELTTLYFRLFTEVGIIAHLSQNRLARVLPEGLSIAQFGVLNHFSRLGGESAPARLARAFQVTKGAMTNTLQRLEAQRFITIKPDPKDARGKLVTITPLGLRVQREAVLATAGLLDDVVATLPAQELIAILPAMERLRITLDENR
ncbi:MAG: MarR family transcriptional regulator [Alphaproteobacteria bacterium]|nr:MarR family transcriptional regulator [Alphaproteobacteria bacterium]